MLKKFFLDRKHKRKKMPTKQTNKQTNPKQ